MYSFDVYVKIYCTANYVLCFLNQKTNINEISTLTLQMYCGLHFQFRQAHYHS
jgi:hypothetical protein